MPLGKRSTRPGLQVFLETNGFLFSAKFDRDHERPGTMIDRVSAWPVVVPRQPRVDAVRDADVMTRWVGVASQDVDGPLWYSVHAPRERTNRTTRKPSPFGRIDSDVRSFVDLIEPWTWQEMQCGSAYARLRRASARQVAISARQVAISARQAALSARQVAIFTETGAARRDSDLSRGTWRRHSLPGRRLGHSLPGRRLGHSLPGRSSAKPSEGWLLRLDSNQQPSG